MAVTPSGGGHYDVTDVTLASLMSGYLTPSLPLTAGAGLTGCYRANSRLSTGRYSIF